MERFDCRINKRVENKEIDIFLDEIESVCKKHGFSISQEDEQGGFEIEDFYESNIKWLKNANISLCFGKVTDL